MRDPKGADERSESCAMARASSALSLAFSVEHNAEKYTLSSSTDQSQLEFSFVSSLLAP